jgi:hypothetical protein
MNTDRTALYLGLRRSELEWRAELDAAAAAGLEVHVASDAGLDHTGLEPGRTRSFDRSEPTAVQIGQAVDALAPEVVVCWGDKYVGLTAAVAEHCGARGIGAAAAAVVVDKAAQRRALEPYGLNPPWRSGTDLAGLREAVAALGTAAPLVFKAAHCSGGRGLAVVGPGTDLDAVFKLTAENYSGTSDFVIEAYVDGSEHSVSGLVADGDVVVLGVTDKRVDAPLAPSWATSTPSALDGGALARVRDAAVTAVRAVGLGVGGFHVDLRWGPSGPVVLEVGGRLGGDLINSHLIPLAHGGSVHPYEALIRLLATGALPQEAAEPARAAAMVLLPHRDRPAADIAAAALEHPLVQIAEDWPGTDSIVAVLTADDPGALAAAVDDLRRRLP